MITQARLHALVTASYRLYMMPIIAAIAIYSEATSAQQDPFVAVYGESCSVCHGENLEGAAQGTPLGGVELKHGDSIEAISESIAAGFPETGMPGWSQTLDDTEIQRLAIYISERRSSLAYTDFKVAAPLVMPDGVIESELHDFRIETVATGLDPLPFSIAPLPDGRILLTEKTLGLSIISRDGQQSELIRGTPLAYDDGFEIPGILLTFGLGWLMDVALHPDYEENGWIYLAYGDRCTDFSRTARSTA